MLGYLKGNLVWTNNKLLILAVNGVGYEINFLNNLATSDLGSEMHLFIVQKISEYGQTLYGFGTIEEKLIFENLENIKGLGGKVIFTVMSELQIKSVEELRSIVIDSLVKLPGVGKTTAQKFLLGLSNKLDKDFDLEINPIDRRKTDDSKYKNEINLLVDWGVKRNIITDFISSNEDLLEGKSSEEIIQTLLRNVGK